MSTRNPLQRLAAVGQSVWLDYIERGFVTGGDLARMIREDAVSGLTSNPAIFHKALREPGAYHEALATLARRGLAAHEIYEALTIEDVRNAADVLVEVYGRTEGRDGFVSLEVSPHFARDTEGTCAEAERLWTLVNRANLLVKVPGTPEGVPAIRRLIADGINVNVTLLFDVGRYEAVRDAYIAGLEDRLARGKPVDRVASVASFFLSRIDTLVDQRLQSAEDPRARALQGAGAIACARVAYRRFQSMVASQRWQALRERGAGVQRLLWASTGTKNRAYSDVKYVDALIGPETITTLPPETLIAYRDHGDPELRLFDPSRDDESVMQDLIRGLAAAGVEWSSVAPQLEEEGIRKFIEPFDASHAEIRSRLAALRQ